MESFRQNNFTANLAADFRDGKEDYSYWLGLQAHNELQTNTLGTDAGGQISQYYGHWAQDHPNVEEGTCVKSVLKPNGDNFDQVNYFNFSLLNPSLQLCTPIPRKKWFPLTRVFSLLINYVRVSKWGNSTLVDSLV